MINWALIDDNIKEFSFDGRECTGKVVSVYDGDSVKIVFALSDNEPNRLYKWTCRLINIDTPELRTKNTREKEFGIKVRDILREKILNKIVTIKCKTFDKYGRLLVEIFLSKDGSTYSVNNWLIENGYAKQYDGGKKSAWFPE